MKEHPQFIDTFGRIHNNVRISVTDRCNIRCFYCMPNENVKFLPQGQLLTFEEIARFVRVMASAGVERVRLTGGEPLVRSELPKLIEMVRSIDGIQDIALTTNGILLAKHARDLKSAGLDRLNVSLDTIDPQRFEQMARRKGLDAVLEGIAAAQAEGFENIRINAVAIAGITESEAVPLARYCLENDLELRFIEFMPLDAENNWDGPQVLSGEKIRALIESKIQPLVPIPSLYEGQPSSDYAYEDRSGTIGFITPVSEPFCASCNRIRLTADGTFYNCLFSQNGYDIKSLVRDPSKTDLDILELVRGAVTAKAAAHGISDEGFKRPKRAMYQIGG